MILVEADVSGAWDNGTDWARLAGDAVRSAVAHSGHIGLIESAMRLEVSAKFAGDAEVQSLNAAYRGKDKPTNVLSFPMVEAAHLTALARAGAGEALLGDIVLAGGICAAEAAEKGISVENHAAHLLVHGSLHLLGLDHETGEREAEAMEAMEREALRALGIADPYPSEVRS